MQTGDQGYPGNLEMRVTYELTEENELRITYDGVADQDTVINMTNHSYFNLNGHDSGTILKHRVMRMPIFLPVRMQSRFRQENWLM